MGRNLLTYDGVLMMSIGDEEVSNAIQVLNELFGEENQVATFSITRSEGGGLAKQVVKGHDYLLVYAKNIDDFKPLRKPRDVRGQMLTIDEVEYWIEEDWLRKEFGKYGTCTYEEIESIFGPERKLEIDAGIESGLYKLMTKRDGRVLVGRLRRLDQDSSKFYSVMKHLNSSSSDDIKKIGLDPVFDYPKPLSLLKEIVAGATFLENGPSIVLDFFAGSGTTGHAIFELSAYEGKKISFLLVQLPEALSKTKNAEAFQLCEGSGVPENIAELTKIRLRAASHAIRRDSAEGSDLGFRVFKLAESNIRAWDPMAEDLEATFLSSQDHLVEGRTELDVLYEILLKQGLDLCIPIEGKDIAGHHVSAVGGGVLFACLDSHIAQTDVEGLAEGIVVWCEELGVVGDVNCIFRDSAFDNDVAKSNMSSILEQAGFTKIQSL